MGSSGAGALEGLLRTDTWSSFRSVPKGNFQSQEKREPPPDLEGLLAFVGNVVNFVSGANVTTKNNC